MRVSRTITVAICATLFAAGAAQAANLDFVAEAAGNERGIPSGTSLVFDGLSVEFTSANFPYFDDLSGGKPGGLGVCKVLNASDQCVPSDDDNITNGESVTLGFLTPVTFSNLSFTDADHNDLNMSAMTLLIGKNTDPLMPFSFASAVGTVFTGVSSITFHYGGSDPSQFYVNSAVAEVPLPAAGILLIGAVAGLGALRRRG